MATISPTNMPQSRIFLIASLGGILRRDYLGYLLTRFTQFVYPLPTGGMPIAPPWTNGIIIYEMTMLGAILTTVITLLVTAQLAALRPAPLRSRNLAGQNPRRCHRPAR